MIDETTKVEETSTQQALSALEAPNSDQQEAKPTQQALSEAASFKRMREENARLERERNEWMKMAQQMQQPQQQARHEEPAFNPNPDDLVDYKTFKRELDKRDQEINKYKEQSQLSLVETQLRAKYPDLDAVLSKDNLDLLKDREPEIYNTIYSSSDVYSKAASAYKLIKQMGIIQTEQISSDKERVAKNLAKPKPASTMNPNFGSTALGEAASYNGKLTKELREKNYREMKESSKGHYFS